MLMSTTTHAYILRAKKVANALITWNLRSKLGGIWLELQFSRALGIAGFTTAMNREGQVSIVAKMGFSTETVSDAANLLRNSPSKQ